ncbi:ankyrin repeat-containing protein-like protein isoform X2 [Salvia divinorum]|uniref:Ankyrin repeat-containing protein-like protein isoform X2 n=1 Tax=Salvia divinorum TaxID=28513 RepID=A0ABD1HGV4_SALDI
MMTCGVATQNVKGCTALYFAVAAGHFEIAGSMLAEDENLANIKSDVGFWTPVEKADLLTLAINSELYGIATKMVNGDKALIMTEDGNGETLFQVRVLKPLTFLHGNGQGSEDKTITNGKWAPQNRLESIHGVAWQMQDEVSWFKAVERFVRPTSRYKKNNNRLMPHELFVAKHRDLRIEGKKFMKQTAKSCLVVSILIATVAITTAFTVPMATTAMASQSSSIRGCLLSSQWQRAGNGYLAHLGAHVPLDP